MLSTRLRGKNGILYIRGQVSLGDKRIDVKEFSSGTCDAYAASHLMAEYETKLRQQLMFGPEAAVAQAARRLGRASHGLKDIIGDLALREPKRGGSYSAAPISPAVIRLRRIATDPSSSGDQRPS